MTLQELFAKIEAQQDAVDQLYNQVEGFNDKLETMTDDEGAQFEQLSADYERELKVLNQLRTSYKIQKSREDQGKPKRQTQPSAPQAREKLSVGMGAQPRELPAGNWGYENLADFANMVKNYKGHGPDNRWKEVVNAAPAEFAREYEGGDGGFLVPDEMRREIKELIFGESSLLGACDQYTLSGNSIMFNKDEDAPWSSAGIQCYWEGEGQQFTPKKFALDQNQMRLFKLTALVPVTEELLEDAAFVSGYISRKVGTKFDWKLQDALFNGNGAGKLRGIINQPSLVEVAKETSQTADTIVLANIENMFMRMAPWLMPGARWVVSIDALGQLNGLKFGTSEYPVYLPNDSTAGAPYGTLKGLPVFASMAAQTLGDKGDIYLVNLGQYCFIQKAAGMRTAASMHLYFDYDITCFKFVIRCNGDGWWAAASTPPYATSNTISPFVTLAERA